MAKILGLDGLSDQDIRTELQRGGKFVVFSYCVSLLVVTFKRGTDVHFIRAGEGTFLKSLPWTVLSLLLGWWGFPFGLIYTPWAVIENLSGGKDVTGQVLGALEAGQ